LRGPAGPAALWADRRGGPSAGGPARVSAGVRNLDGMADGRSGRVRQCLRQQRTRSHTGGRGPCRPDTDQAHRTWRHPWPAAAAVPVPCPATRTRVARPRGSREPRQVSTLVAGVREAGGHPSGRSPRRGHQSGHWQQSGHVYRTPSSGQRSSGQQSFRNQRTVNPLIVPAEDSPVSRRLQSLQSRPCVTID
jgi:hypothetical protein